MERKICAAYIRVSTEDQMEYSPESQRKLLHEYAKKNGMLLPEEFIYTDDGISGRKAEKRPGFMALISAAKSKPRPFDTILVWKFSRFARNQEESIVYKSMLRRQCGIEVISVSEQLPTGEFGSLIERIIEWMDEYYSIRLSGEVRRGMTQRVQQGKTVSAAPIGYTYKNRQLVVQPDEAEAVRMIFRDLLAGMSVSDIAEELNRLGIRTKRGGKWENRAVRYVLMNPVYIGRIRWSPEGAKDYHRAENVDQRLQWICGEHEPILSEDTFEQVQAILKTAQRNRRNVGSPHRENGSMLRGLVRCSACGGILTAAGGGMNCSRYAHGKCRESHYITREILEEVVLTAIEAQLAGLQVELCPAIHTAEQTSLLEKQIQKEEYSLERSRDAYLAGIDTLREYSEKKAASQERLQDLRAQLAEERSAMTKERSIPNFHFAAGFLRDANVSASVKNQLLLCFVDHIVFDKENKTVTIFYAG